MDQPTHMFWAIQRLHFLLIWLEALLRRHFPPLVGCGSQGLHNRLDSGALSSLLTEMSPNSGPGCPEIWVRM